MIRNDITKVAADAIVNPANRNLLQGSGTLAYITGGIAESFYGMPPELQQETLKRLPEDRTGRTAKHPPTYCVQSTVHGRVRFCCGLFALSEQVET